MLSKLQPVVNTLLLTLAVAFLACGNAFAISEKAICSFPGPPNEFPTSGLIFDSAGNLYGTTGGHVFGLPSNGTVFEASPKSGGGWACKQIYGFRGSPNDGANPAGGLVMDKLGNLYGTTGGGGTNGMGVAFELSPTSSGRWTEKIIANFEYGLSPNAPLVFDNKGNLFGTTIDGGIENNGTVFELTPEGNGSWSLQTIYSFTGKGDASGPDASLTLDGSGNLYGTTYAGGANNLGTVFDLMPTSNGWTEKILYSFVNDGVDGTNPHAAVVFDALGNLYGTAENGGDSVDGCGTVFELMPQADGNWTETIIFQFSESQGCTPVAPVIFDGHGNLYGTTWFGGNSQGTNEVGTVFRLSQSGGQWSETALYPFTLGNDGFSPEAGVIFDKKGDVYGTTYCGGSGENALLCEGIGFGVVFEISK
jgi:uncharacterized repeat protein (TIGR03803 family)